VTVGIKDVARAAGLSITTVSHALNGKGQVSAATRERVRAVADELGYHPNPAARVLLSGRSGVIGVIAGHQGGEPWERTYRPYYAALTSGAMIAALDRDYALIVVPLRPGSDLWGRVPMDGVIVVDPVADDPVIAEARKRGLAVVADGRPPGTVPGGAADVPHVHSDMQHGLGLVLTHLVDSGARRIGLLTGPELDAYTLDTEQAYTAWCAKTGQPPVLVRVDPGGHEPEGHALEAARTLLTGAGRPDAVHAINETYAAALLQAAAELELDVPNALMVTAMGEDIGGHSSLTRLSLDTRRIGATCAEMLIDVLAGVDREPVTVPCELILGSSTARE
jgi:DNA-binding LacI/PurR family transcriptional regulator